MTKETCKTYYLQAKEEGDKKQMEFWKERFSKKGGDVTELEPKKESKKKTTKSSKKK